MNLQRFVANATCVGALLFGVAAAQAAPIVWDWSPSATGATVTNNNWTNIFGAQYFGEIVQFAGSTVVSGMDIYMTTSYGAVGNAVKVSIWADAGGGVPGALLDTVSALVSEVDLDGAVAGNHRVHADFSGFTMLGGVGYLIGMAGDGVLLTQTGLSGIAGGDGRVAQFDSAGFEAMAYPWRTWHFACMVRAPMRYRSLGPLRCSVWASSAWLPLVDARNRASSKSVTPHEKPLFGGAFSLLHVAPTIQSILLFGDVTGRDPNVPPRESATGLRLVAMLWRQAAHRRVEP